MKGYGGMKKAGLRRGIKRPRKGGAGRKMGGNIKTLFSNRVMAGGGK